MVLSIDKIKNITIDMVPKYSIKKVFLFGSYADGTANENSDVDFMIEFDTTAVSLFVISRLKYELESLLGKPVDVIHGPLSEKSMIEINKVVALYE